MQKAQVGEDVLESVTKYLDVNYAPQNVARTYINGKMMEMRQDFFTDDARDFVDDAHDLLTYFIQLISLHKCKHVN